MGQKSYRPKIKFNKRQNLNSFIGKEIICPFCSKKFEINTIYNILNKHLNKCGTNYIRTNTCCKIYQSKNDLLLNKLIFDEIKQYKSKAKKPLSQTELDLESKIEILHTEILKKKISWENGFCPIDINRQNFLAESIEKIKTINVYKEWKVNFIGELSYDAGGVIREWFTIIFKDLESEKLKLFLPSESKNFSYIINPFLTRNKDNFSFFSFIGKLIAKALIDNITINLCFNKMIYKLLLEEKITFEDLIFIDYPLYESLNNLKKENIDYEKLDFFYDIEMKDYTNNLHTFEIIDNGKNIPVTDINDYINKRIYFMIGLYEPFVREIRNSIYSIIPKNVIQNFTSDEFELLVNGRPFIDIEEWKQFTEYKEPYYPGHKIIQWFWEIVSEFNQNELSNLLLFSTGSSRVPLSGFSVLESNRGNVAKYTIESIDYYKGRKNFIKAHTCFNRLDIPLFNDKKELEDALHFICNNQIYGFGID